MFDSQLKNMDLGEAAVFTLNLISVLERHIAPPISFLPVNNTLRNGPGKCSQDFTFLPQPTRTNRGTYVTW